MVTYRKDKRWTLDTSILLPVSSNELGGAYIDQAIQRNIKEHLEHIAKLKGGWTPETVAQAICRDRKYFEAKTNLKPLQIPLPGAGQNTLIVGTQRDDGLLIDHQELKIHE